MRITQSLCASLTIAFLALPCRALEPTFYEGFDNGKIDGPAGMAGNRLSIDARGVVNMDRGTLAFFYKSDTPPRETEWGGPGGVRTERDCGYWSMGAMFQLRRAEFMFNLYDMGFFAPPMRYPSIFGRWQAGEWHHLAAVWDRGRGIRVYEDGKCVSSNWDEYEWAWSSIPEELSLAGPLDEVYVFADCLTDAQVAELAQGKPPSGEPITATPPAGRRDAELRRMGWTAEGRAALPSVAPQAPATLTFARIGRCVDAKRPVAYLFEGLNRTTWPSHKYGPSIRGQRLDIQLAPVPDMDRVRLFVHRPFKGRLVRTVDCADRTVAELAAEHAGFLHVRLDKPLDARQLALERDGGQLGHIDFYGVASGAPDSAERAQTFAFAKADAFPDTDQGRDLMAETPRRNWRPLKAVTETVPAWVLQTPAFGGFQAVCAEPEAAAAFDGARVELVVDALAQPTPVRIEIKEPVYPARTWLAGDAVLTPSGPGRQTFTIVLKGKPVINLPPLETRKYLKDGKYSDERVTVPGLGCSMTLLAADPVSWAMGEGGCRLALLETDMQQALTTAADDQVEWMREAYAESMEGHAYGWDRIQAPLLWLALFAPERMEFRQMWERVGAPNRKYVALDIPALEMPEPENAAGAPAWAFWQMQAVDRIRRHVHWIIDNKQVWTGEFGGLWNDDSTHVENWMGYMLCLDGSGKIRDAMQRYWDGLWTHQLVDGVGKYTQDNCHYSEEGTSAQSMRNLIDYGDPVAYARAMRSVAHVEAWLTEVAPGEAVFKSVWIGPEGAWTEGAFRIDKNTGHCWDPVVPLGYLTWYNRHPEAARLLRALKPEGHGLLGPAYFQVTDWSKALAQFGEDVTQPVDRRGPIAQIRAINALGLTDAAREAHAVAYTAPPGPVAHYWGSRDTDQHWFAWKVSGDIRFLEDSYRRVCEWFYSHDWLNSAAMPSMDRCPLPRGSVIRSRIGALAANRGSSGVMWPFYALSYTRGGDRTAALVTENVDNRFAVRLYPFTPSAHEMQVRVWRCNGRFEVSLADDADDDGVAEAVYWKREMTLDRGAGIDFTLKPQQASILTVTPLEPAPVDFDKADPAISLNTVELVYGDHLVVRVYNNGTRPVEDVLVRAVDMRTGGKLVNGEKRTGPIEAPTDFTPRFRTVEFKNANCSAYGTIAIELDPEHEVDDFNRHNNRVVLDYKGTYLKHGGWK